MWKWLTSTKTLQEDYYRFNFDELRRDPNAFANYITWNHTAAVVELGEALNEVGWKPWAKPRGWFNREAFIGECVDANHFIANMLVAVGATDEEYEVAYQKKQEINRQRQRDGYDGLNKCLLCGRALDDPTTECRVETNTRTKEKDDMAWCQTSHGWFSRSLVRAARTGEPYPSGKSADETGDIAQ